MKHFALMYEAVPDMIDRRASVRAEHLALLRNEKSAGRLVLAGAFAGDPPASLLVFKCEDDAPVRAFAEQDPYVTTGLITKWFVREWVTVMGAGATSPIST